MSDIFDPYVQWLGIRDPQRPPNHYRLLGVELFEGDADVLTHAADRQMSHVRTFQTGRHSAVSQRLLNEIATAKVCLLNHQKKAEYDARLRWDMGYFGMTSAPAAPPGGAAPPGSSGAWPAVVSGGMPPPIVAPPSAVGSPAMAQPPPAVPGGGRVVASAPAAVESGPAPGGAPAPAHAEWSQTTSLVVTGLGSVILMLVGLIVYVTYTPPGHKDAPTENPNEIGRIIDAPRTGSATVKPLAAASPKPAAVGPGSSAVKPAAPPGGTQPAAAVGKVAPPAKPDTVPPAAKSEVTAKAEPAPPGAPAKTEAAPADGSAKAEPKPAPKPEAKPEGKPAAKPEAKPAAASDKGGGASGGTPAAVPGTLAQALAAAREAMQARDRDAAKERFVAARRLAKPDDADTIKQFQVVYDYWDWFWKSYAKGLKALKLGQSLDVDDKKVEIVGVAGEDLTVRQDNQEKKYGRLDTPIELAATISMRWIPDNNAALLAKAAALCFERAGSAAEIRKLVETAASGGLSGSEILAELKATPSTGSATPAENVKRLPVPDLAARKTKLAAIQAALKAEYDKPLDKRQPLAGTLFQQGLDARDDPPARFVNFSEALDQAVEQGDAALIDKIVQALAESFDVDPLAVKVESVRQAAQRVKTPAAISGIARLGLTVAAEAVQNDKLDEAVALADICLTLAKKVTDRQAIRDAVALQHDLHAAAQLFADYGPAHKTLAAKPDDPRANLIVGEYYCFVKNDWTQGVPLLLKGNDGELRKLAEPEQTPPSEPADMVKLGDRWWLATKTLDPALRRWAQLRAGAWYKKAQPNLTGPAKGHVEQRLKELGLAGKK